ncbi:MAG: hypothetical protein JW739_05705 [Opitutales bacterium]|nr:hypothetical protein [Opitutales bacterium]
MKELILICLSKCPHDLGMRQSTLTHELSRRLRDIPGEGDVASSLLDLEQTELVKRTKDLVTGDTIWIATEKGRNAIK